MNQRVCMRGFKESLVYCVTTRDLCANESLIRDEVTGPYQARPSRGSTSTTEMEERSRDTTGRAPPGSSLCHEAPATPSLEGYCKHFRITDSLSHSTTPLFRMLAGLYVPGSITVAKPGL
jgi:hypothetical protein